MFRFVLSTLAFTSIFNAPNAMALKDPSKVEATYSTAYAPRGFDSNDHVQIVAEGTFSSSCYRHAETTVQVDKVNKKIYLGPAAYQYPGWCLQVVLPFDRTIDLGILPPGDYQILQTSASGSLGTLNIRKATTESPDDYLYAPISQAFFRNKGLLNEIFLTGEFPNSCMKLEDVKVSVEDKSIVVQPIVKVEGQNCRPGKFHFEKVVEAELIASGRYLLHVRSMNAKAINSLVDVK